MKARYTLPLYLSTVLVAGVASCVQPATAQSYGKYGSMDYGPLRPFDSSTVTHPKVKCVNGKCTLTKDEIAGMLKKAYEEGKGDAQAVCGSRT